MKPDLRGFAYAMEPVLQRLRWQLEARQAQLARHDQQVAAAVSALDAHEAAFAQALQHAAATPARPLDPVSRAGQLRWLAAGRAEAVRRRETLEGLQRVRRVLAADCLAGISKLRAIEQHREAALHVHGQLLQQRDADAADADWLMRRGAAAAARTGSRGR